MGCGCGRSNMASLQKSRAVSSQSVTTPKVGNSAVCIKKYDELAALDKKAIALHSKFKFVSGTGKRFADIQKIIRGWIMELKDRCPDETDLATYSQYINSEYAKYFSI